MIEKSGGTKPRANVAGLTQKARVVARIRGGGGHSLDTIGVAQTDVQTLVGLGVTMKRLAKYLVRLV